MSCRPRIIHGGACNFQQPRDEHSNLVTNNSRHAHHDTTTPRHHDTTTPQHHDTTTRLLLTSPGSEPERRIIVARHHFCKHSGHGHVLACQSRHVQQVACASQKGEVSEPEQDGMWRVAHGPVATLPLEQGLSSLLIVYSTTCRERHVKCDEARPNCRACQRANRPCNYAAGSSIQTSPDRDNVK